MTPAAPDAPDPFAADSATPATPAAHPSRRDFCLHACQAASLAAVGAVLPGCGGGGNPNSPSPVGSGNTTVTIVPSSVAGRTVSVTVDAAGALGATGGVAAIETSLGPFLLARTGPTTFNVMTAVCTHEACTVNGYNGLLFVCPCHNSKYTTDGTVANGPAFQPLRRYTATFVGTTLTFTA